MTNIPPIDQPTIKWVLSAEGDWEYKPASKKLAEILKKAVTDLHTSIGAAAQQAFLMAEDQELSAAKLSEALDALAQLSDEAENSAQVVIQALLGHHLAFVKPPSGTAVAAVIQSGTPREQN